MKFLGKTNLKSLAAFVLILFIAPLSSEKQNFSEYLSLPVDRSLLSASSYFDASSIDYHLATVPFHFPWESTLSPGFTSQKQSLGMEILYSVPFSNMSSWIIGKEFSPSETIKVSVYESTAPPEYTNLTKETMSYRLPLAWNQNQSTMVNRNPGVVFVYMRKGFGFNMDLSFRISGNLAGQAMIDTMNSGAGFSYNIPSDKLSKKQYYAKLNLNMQIQESTSYAWEEKLKKSDTHRYQRNLFISPGFTVGNRSVMLEGLVRMPLPHTGAAYESEFLGKPEIQGRLGLKWYLPEMMQP
jgi:hypothetical protein